MSQYEEDFDFDEFEDFSDPDLARHKRADKIKWILVLVGFVLVAVMLVGIFCVLFARKAQPANEQAEAQATYKIAAVEYNPLFGEKFETEHPLPSLSSNDNLASAPFAYGDTSLFQGKRITKIAAPVATVKAVDANQYFTLWVVKASVVKAGGKIADGEYSQHRIYLPREELTSTAVNKWITVDLSDQFIYVGEDETLAFMASDDPVICKYSGGSYATFVRLSSSASALGGQSIYYGVWGEDIVDLTGKKLSILGDSISTYQGYSNDKTSANTTIGNNAVYYPKGSIDNTNETWWMQSVLSTNMTLLVNNSWSGSRITNGSGAAYAERCEQLHSDIGEDQGTPDVIAVYMGINDLRNKVEAGEYKSLSSVYSESTGYKTPETFAEGYEITIHKAVTKYADADVFVFTLPPCSGANLEELGQYNDIIRAVAKEFGCYVVELGAVEGYTPAAYTDEGLHPNEAGMDLITDLFVRSLKGAYSQGENLENKEIKE